MEKKDKAQTYVTLSITKEDSTSEEALSVLQQLNQTVQRELGEGWKIENLGINHY